MTLDELRAKHKNVFAEKEPGVTEIYTQPSFAIGQRAFLIETPQGNLLWDCIALLDDGTREFIRSRGGLKWMAISHPHYYTTMVEWAREFDCRVWLHARDREHVQRIDERLLFWDEALLKLSDSLTLVQAGGHFAGGTVLHWDSRGGVLFSGDLLQVNADRKSVSVMWSYPNWLPLGPKAVSRVFGTVEDLEFDRIYGAFPTREIVSDAKAVVARSRARILELLSD
jgi:glyoxylase-like metal-dependent hydrolase (beta-lactamase superfamily II)